MSKQHTNKEFIQSDISVGELIRANILLQYLLVQTKMRDLIVSLSGKYYEIYDYRVDCAYRLKKRI